LLPSSFRTTVNSSPRLRGLHRTELIHLTSLYQGDMGVHAPDSVDSEGTYELINESFTTSNCFLLSATCSSREAGRWSLIWNATCLETRWATSFSICSLMCGL
jgi:hypothetical protein